MLFLNSDIRKCKKKSDELYRKMNKLEEKIDSGCADRNMKEVFKDLCDEFDYYNENVYAKAIFDYFSKKKPKLIRVRTKEVFEWDDVFKENFDDITKIDRCVLVGLIEQGSKYKIK